MEISEYRERMREYVEGDKFWLDDEQWWAEVTDLALLVLAERTRVKRERAQANPVYRAWKERQVPTEKQAPKPTPTTRVWRDGSVTEREARA